MSEICFVIAVLLPYRGFVFLFVVTPTCSLLFLPPEMTRSRLHTTGV